jgi:hypothetical protein
VNLFVTREKNLKLIFNSCWTFFVPSLFFTGQDPDLVIGDAEVVVAPEIVDDAADQRIAAEAEVVQMIGNETDLAVVQEIETGNLVVDHVTEKVGPEIEKKVVHVAKPDPAGPGPNHQEDLAPNHQDGHALNHRGGHAPNRLKDHAPNLQDGLSHLVAQNHLVGQGLGLSPRADQDLEVHGSKKILVTNIQMETLIWSKYKVLMMMVETKMVKLKATGSEKINVSYEKKKIFNCFIAVFIAFYTTKEYVQSFLN